MTREICTSLLGPESVADDKAEYGVRLDVNGYTINQPDHRVLISRYLRPCTASLVLTCLAW